MPSGGCINARRTEKLNPVWCRLVVVAAALYAGYEQVLSVDSDTVIHQPYARLEYLRRFGSVNNSRARNSIMYGPQRTLGEANANTTAMIGTSNGWWFATLPCGGNILFLNRPNTQDLLRAWWAVSRDHRFAAVGPGNGMNGHGQREQAALWILLKDRKWASMVATVRARSLWCLEQAAGRPGCEAGLRGCPSD
eukprot:4682783-Prymnesium_polylepis.1